MSMQHFLLTRFNLRINGYHDNATDVNWLADRFYIFEKFCLPSVLNQTNHNFIWVIFFDKDTPEIFKEKALSLTNISNHIKVLFIDGFNELNKNCQALIAPYIHEKYIITSRLDNDDIIHKEFIATIQRLALPIHRQVIDLRKGYQMVQQKENCSFKLKADKFNAFISVVEDSSAYKTVLTKEHPQWKTETRTVIFNQKRLWIEFVHGNNITNAVKPYIPLTHNIKPQDFSLKNLNITPSKIRIMATNFIKSPLFLAFFLYKEIMFKLNS